MLGDPGDGDRTDPDRRGHPLERAVADVTGREHARRDLLQRADEALYASKAAGRGRATRYDPGARRERRV
jgi:hypothetical protein